MRWLLWIFSHRTPDRECVCKPRPLFQLARTKTGWKPSCARCGGRIVFLDD